MGDLSRRVRALTDRAASAPIVVPPDQPDLPLTSAADIASLLADTVRRVRKGRLDPRVAMTVGALAGTLLRALEVGEFEERLPRLEGSLDPANPGRLAGSIHRPLLGPGHPDHPPTAHRRPCSMRLTQHRLDELEGRLSPKQMVLVFIEERRAAGSMVARAQPLLDSYEGAPCQRIEGAIRRSGRLYTTTRSRWRVLSAMRRRRGCS